MNFYALVSVAKFEFLYRESINKEVFKLEKKRVKAECFNQRLESITDGNTNSNGFHYLGNYRLESRTGSSLPKIVKGKMELQQKNMTTFKGIFTAKKCCEAK